MPLPRSASMMPPLRRSRSASMSSLAQVNLSTLDAEVVLEYARKVMQLQPQPATPSEKLHMLFALSQKLLRWFVEDQTRRERQTQLVQDHEKSLPSKATDRTDAVVAPLHIQKMEPQRADVMKLKEADKPSLASRILASAVAPVVVADVKLGIPLDEPAQTPDNPAQWSSIRPAELVTTPIRLGKRPELSNLQPVAENEQLVISTTISTVAGNQASRVVQETAPKPTSTTDALEVYLQVQRSVICMQKYVRGFMARRRFYRALEELLQGRA